MDCNSLQLIPDQDGSCILLDIGRDRILRLNAIGAEMWNSLSLGVPESEIVETISRKYKVNEQRVGTDLRSLLEKISDLQLAPTNSVSVDAFGSHAKSEAISYPWYGGSSVSRPNPKRTTTLAAIFGLALFDLILWVRSLKSLCSCVNSWPVAKRALADPEDRGRVCAAVESACKWYPKQTLCLQRSAVTVCLLRNHGHRAQMKIGLRPMPFLAHAWVEVDGSIVNDWPGVRTFYTSVASHETLR
jgi:Transglutaminase-like superfamily/Coenzyme PQQ synthesis protein D (PqqD)